MPRSTNHYGNKTETAFAKRAQAKGYAVLRRGWPDFLLMRQRSDKSFEFLAVEVKRAGDVIRPDQVTMHAALSQMGVRVFVWTPSSRQLKRLDIDPLPILQQFIAEQTQDYALVQLAELRELQGR
jgi:hypothetical protein